jgi:hypothetical protein
MAADAIALADAVVVDLGLYPWPEEPEILRGWISPERALKDMKALTIDVFAVEVETEMATRGSDAQQTRVELWFQRKLDDVTAAGVDPWVRAVQGLRNFWRRRRPTAYDAAACWGTEWLAAAMPEQLKEHRLWVSGLALLFREDAAA